MVFVVGIVVLVVIVFVYKFSFLVEWIEIEVVELDLFLICGFIVFGVVFVDLLDQVLGYNV